MARSLRGLFPHLWSNSRPNSATCTFTLSHVCSVIKKLFSLDSSFFSSCSRTKHIVTLLNSEVVLSISAVRKNPSFPWDRIWDLAANDLLDNKLQDFQWRLAHGVLYTGKRIKDWGMGDGICPFGKCSEIETIDHIFWECDKAKPIVQWVSSVVKSMIGNFKLQASLFLYGFPEINVSKPVLQRIWFLFCLSKFILWKSRCIHIFEGHEQSSSILLSKIVCKIKDRVRADRIRFKIDKFNKLWIHQSSFVSVCNNKLNFHL